MSAQNERSLIISKNCEKTMNHFDSFCPNPIDVNVQKSKIDLHKKKKNRAIFAFR